MGTSDDSVATSRDSSWPPGQNRGFTGSFVGCGLGQELTEPSIPLCWPERPLGSPVWLREEPGKRPDWGMPTGRPVSCPAKEGTRSMITLGVDAHKRTHLTDPIGGVRRPSRKASPAITFARQSNE